MYKSISLWEGKMNDMTCVWCQEEGAWNYNTVFHSGFYI